MIHRRIQSKNGPLNGESQYGQGIVVSNDRLAENFNNIIPGQEGSVGIIGQIIVIIPVYKIIGEGWNKGNESEGQYPQNILPVLTIKPLDKRFFTFHPAFDGILVLFFIVGHRSKLYRLDDISGFGSMYSQFYFEYLGEYIDPYLVQISREC